MDFWWKLKAALLFQRFVFIHDVLIFSFLSSVGSKHSDRIKQINQSFLQIQPKILDISLFGKNPHDPFVANELNQLKPPTVTRLSLASPLHQSHISSSSFSSLAVTVFRLSASRQEVSTELIHQADPGFPSDSSTASHRRVNPLLIHVIPSLCSSSSGCFPSTALSVSQFSADSEQ